MGTLTAQRVGLLIMAVFVLLLFGFPHQSVALDGRPLPKEADCSAGAYGQLLHEREAALMMRVGKKEAGRVLDGRTWDEFPVASASPVTA